jgi:hypothetical protein
MFFEDQDYATSMYWLKAGCSLYGFITSTISLAKLRTQVLSTDD